MSNTIHSYFWPKYILPYPMNQALAVPLTATNESLILFAASAIKALFKEPNHRKDGDSCVKAIFAV